MISRRYPFVRRRLGLRLQQRLVVEHVFHIFERFFVRVALHSTFSGQVFFFIPGTWADRNHWSNFLLQEI